MAITANVGPVTFSFVTSTRARVPDFETRPFDGHDGEAVAVADAASEAYLVVDHRGGTGPTSRVELWRPEGWREGPLGGLLVFADASAPGPAQEFRDLGDLVRELGRTG